MNNFLALYRIPIRKIVVLVFVAGICGLAVAGIAQMREVQEKIPEGKWVLEKVSAFEENVEITPFNLDSISCCTIPIEIAIQKENIALMGKDKVKYNGSIRGKFLCFPICAEWQIVEKKLQLQWVQDIESQESRMRTIVLTYQLK